jgi:hypothetical protein
VLQRLAEHGLIQGERIGVDASTMEANAALRAPPGPPSRPWSPRGTGSSALRSIVRGDTGEGYQAMLARMAAESGIATPTTEDLIRLDRRRKGKRLSNQDWTSPSDPEAKIAKLKDGRTHLAYKPEHASTSTPGRSSRPRSPSPTKATPRPCRRRSRQRKPIWRRLPPRRGRRTRPSWWRTKGIMRALA